ncbi:MAG: glycosyltransferase family 25 protein [Pyrinomonadaceae bacterium]
MNVNDFFPDKVCINLDRRPERWEQAEARFALHQINSVRRFPAIDGLNLKVPPGWDGSPGAYGCLQSHLAVVREARRSGLSGILIFEDDVVLDSDFNTKFSRYIEQLPSDWDMLLFGGLHVYVRPLKISENISKITNSYSTFAYALKRTIYDAFIELNSQSLEPVDKVNAILQQTFNCYCFIPHLAWVEENYSDTQNKQLHPWYVKEAVVVASPEWNQIQKDTVLIIAHRDSTPDRSQTRNLHFKLDYCAAWYPHVTVLVVEHDNKPGLEPQTLPGGVHYKFLRDENAFNPESCFQAGLRMFESSKEFFIFSESDLHLDREDIIANLELCQQYDFVSSYKHLIELTEEDTQIIIRGEELDLTCYERRERPDICHGSCFFTRKGIERVGGWEAAAQGRESELQSLKVRRLLSIFESPNKALRLSQSNGHHLSLKPVEVSR